VVGLDVRVRTNEDADERANTSSPAACWNMARMR